MFVAAARAALHLTGASASALAAALGELVTVSWEAGEGALTAVATEEEALGGKSRCVLNRSRRYMLRKALSVPPPPAPEVLARTLTTVTLRVHRYVGSAPLSPPPHSLVRGGRRLEVFARCGVEDGLCDALLCVCPPLDCTQGRAVL